MQSSRLPCLPRLSRLSRLLLSLLGAFCALCLTAGPAVATPPEEGTYRIKIDGDSCLYAAPPPSNAYLPATLWDCDQSPAAEFEGYEQWVLKIFDVGAEEPAYRFTVKNEPELCLNDNGTPLTADAADNWGCADYWFLFEFDGKYQIASLGGSCLSQPEAPEDGGIRFATIRDCSFEDPSYALWTLEQI